MSANKFNVSSLKRPVSEDLFNFIEWFCNSLGVFSFKDKNRTGGKVFLSILNASVRHNGVNSEHVASECNISRGNAIYHLNNLIELGLVEKKGRKYFLRESSLFSTVASIEEDFLSVFSKVKDYAKKIDDLMILKE